MTIQHTPTPWVATPIGQGTNDFCIHAAGIPWQLAYLAANSQIDWPIEANAAFIVRAVNSHDDLVAALKEAREYVAERADAEYLPGGPVGNEEMRLLVSINDALERSGA